MILKLFFFSLFFFFSVQNYARTFANTENIINKLLSEKGLVVLYEQDGKPLFQRIYTQTILPASIQKILLARLAIRYLGLNYRFSSFFYEDRVGRLIIQGRGDPFIISEEIKVIAENLKQRKKTKFSALILDNSLFEQTDMPGVYESMRPHDSLNGALIVNFNTINLKKDAEGKIFSAEEQTPLTEVGKEFGKHLSKNSKQRINLGKDPKKNLLYAHQLFFQIFRKEGIEIKNSQFFQKKTPLGLQPFYIHYNTRDLNQILRVLLKYSNNYIANQIMLVIGAENYGYPTGLKKGMRTLNALIVKEYGFEEKNIFLAEASGISRENRITLRAMLRVLMDFKPYAYLLNHRGSAIYKTGTLTGIYNSAGYLQKKDGSLRPFIIHNILRNNRNAILEKLEFIHERI